MELVDTLDLGSSASRCEGSSPFARTKAEEKSSAFLFLTREFLQDFEPWVQHRYNILTFFVDTFEMNSFDLIYHQMLLS